VLLSKPTLSVDAYAVEPLFSLRDQSQSKRIAERIDFHSAADDIELIVRQRTDFGSLIQLHGRSPVGLWVDPIGSHDPHIARVSWSAPFLREQRATSFFLGQRQRWSRG
jgi:hypothetical protein